MCVKRSSADRELPVAARIQEHLHGVIEFEADPDALGRYLSRGGRRALDDE